MNLIELHILHSVPASCLNRDQLNSPKTFLFGDVERARVSSQCWKRAARDLARELRPEYFGGVRTRKAANELEAQLVALGWETEQANPMAKQIMDFLLSKGEKEGGDNANGKKGKKKSKTDDTSAETEEAVSIDDSSVKTDDKKNTSTLLYFSPKEIQSIANLADKLFTEKKMAIANKKQKDSIKKVLDGTLPSDAVDIALFGRMVANAPEMKVDGAACFNQAFSTHEAISESDFWTAVDDRLGKDESGAANMGDAEFNSACYYRFITLNLDSLFSKDHLGMITESVEKKEVVACFLRAVIMSVPQAKKNSMFANTAPSYILGIRRVGQPLSLANAFESPVVSDGNGYIKGSVEALKNHWEVISKKYELNYTECDLSAIEKDDSEITISSLIETLTEGL